MIVAKLKVQFWFKYWLTQKSLACNIDWFELKSKYFFYLYSINIFLYCSLKEKAGSSYTSDIILICVGLLSHNLEKDKALWNHRDGVTPIVQI